MILDQTDTNISKNINFLCFENNLKTSQHHTGNIVCLVTIATHSCCCLPWNFLVFVYEMSIAPLLMLSAILHFAIFCTEELGSHSFKVKTSQTFYVDELDPSFQIWRKGGCVLLIVAP